MRYWFEFGLFLPTVELLETLLTSRIPSALDHFGHAHGSGTVYNESRMQVLVARLRRVVVVRRRLAGVA